MYTSSSLFLKALSDANVKTAFVNWGSDHPALLEDLQRQREENKDTAIQIITSPNEMVALSAAQGYAQLTGAPAVVLVHVDVGTQALGGAVHNVSRSHTPVIIYAGASAYSSGQGLKGGRGEWIMWLQVRTDVFQIKSRRANETFRGNIPDQSAVVRQYMKFTSELYHSKMIAPVVQRAVQIATSDPKGPVYLWARREIMEQDVNKDALSASTLTVWPRVEPVALRNYAVDRIAHALLAAKAPLIITSHLGRNRHAVPVLAQLSRTLAVAVISVTPSTINIPHSHPCFVGTSFLHPGTHYEGLKDADLILVIECDLPWIPDNDRPSTTASIFIINSGDPLRPDIGFQHGEADMICQADAQTALAQITSAVVADSTGFDAATVQARMEQLEERHKAMLHHQESLENNFSLTRQHTSIDVPNIIGLLRKKIRAETTGRVIFLNETISNYGSVWQHLMADSDVFSSGGSSLGWALGAAVGMGVAKEPYELLVAIVGDGSFLFGVPSSSFWMARKYDVPFLTIVLNNGGWKSPKLSMLGVYPNGLGSKVGGDQLTVGFGPACPDYSAIAVSASSGWAWGTSVADKSALEKALEEGIRIVKDENRCAVVDCIIESI